MSKKSPLLVNSIQVEGRGKLTWNGEDVLLSTDPSWPAEVRRGHLPQPRSRSSPFDSQVERAHSDDESRHDDPLPGKDTTQICSPSGTTAERNTKICCTGQIPPSTAPCTRPDRTNTTPSRALTSTAGLTARRSSQSNMRPSTFPSPQEKRTRVETALDRMGAGVIEVRDAYERWVRPRRRVATGTARDGADISDRSGRLAELPGQAGSDVAAPPSVAAKPTSNHLDSGNLNEHKYLEKAFMDAMVELRLPAETAHTFCREAGPIIVALATGTGPISFSDFVERYAEAAGLLAGSSPSERKGPTIWAEGPRGMWMAVAFRDLSAASAAFRRVCTRKFQFTESDEERE